MNFATLLTGFFTAVSILLVDMIISTNLLFSLIIGFLPLILGSIIFRSETKNKIQNIYLSTAIIYLIFSILVSVFSQDLAEVLNPIIISYTEPGGLAIDLTTSPGKTLIGLFFAYTSIYLYKERFWKELFDHFDE
jgi:hypothetical protein